MMKLQRLRKAAYLLVSIVSEYAAESLLVNQRKEKALKELGYLRCDDPSTLRNAMVIEAKALSRRISTSRESQRLSKDPKPNWRNCWCLLCANCHHGRTRRDLLR